MSSEKEPDSIGSDRDESMEALRKIFADVPVDSRRRLWTTESQRENVDGLEDDRLDSVGLLFSRL